MNLIDNRPNSIIFKKYSVSLDKSNYEILIGRDIITTMSQFLVEKTKDKRILIVIDEFFRAKNIRPAGTVAVRFRIFSAYVHNFEAGKHHKNISEAMKIYEVLESNDFAGIRP